MAGDGGKTRSRHYVRNLALFGLTFLLLSLLIFVGGLVNRAKNYYIHPDRIPLAPGENPAREGIAYSDVRLTTSDGVELAAWYTPPQNGVVVLSAHGFPGHRVAGVHALFARHGYGVLSWDMRAQGESGGATCTMGFNEVYDAQAALEYALAQPGVEHVYAYGQSMGAVTVIRAAAVEPRIEAVVADSAFYNLRAMSQNVMDIPLAGPLTIFFAELEAGIDTNQVSAVAVIGQLAPRPVFIIQGDADELIPLDSGRRLFDAAGEPRQLWLAPGAPHVGVMSLFPEEYERRVIAFFDQAGE